MKGGNSRVSISLRNHEIDDWDSLSSWVLLILAKDFLVKLNLRMKRIKDKLGFV